MTPKSPKKSLPRVLFVCIGNSCRSQMAEAFARTYGSDAMIPASAGVAPALMVAADTRRAMKEKNISLDDHFPKAVKQLNAVRFDIVVNMSGVDFPLDYTPDMREWDVRDPIGTKYDTHCEIRDEIERLVMELVLELRRRATQPQA